MKYFNLNLIFCFVLLCINNAFSQSDSSTNSLTKKERLFQAEKKEKDMIDILHFKRFGDEDPAAKKKSKPRITVVPFVGYTLQTRLAGIIAGNMAFYIGTDDETNQSAISTSISYSQNNQIVFPLFSNLWTKKNKFNILGNWRYYKYPEQTYGLGGHTSLSDLNKIDYSYILFRESVLRHVSNSDFYLGIGYNLSYHFNINEKGYANGQPTDFEKYGKRKTSISSGVSFHALFDNRGNTINPPKGAYANVTYIPYFKALGGDNNWQALIVDLRKYFKLGQSKNVLAFWSYNWFTFNGNAPYLDLPSTGWDSYSNVGRGYIQSRLKGANLVYLEAEYRFRITHNGLLGGVLFSNAQSVSNWPNNKFDVIYPSIGTGIRIKLNKHSGTNLAIDYGIGIKGSRGLFINLGEVF